MNLAQLDNIKLRLAAVRGRPWVISKADKALVVGPKHDYRPARDIDFWYEVDCRVEFCDACSDRLQSGRAKVDAARARGEGATVDMVGSPESMMCAECKKKTHAMAQVLLAAFVAHTADADECQWLAKAAEDEESLISALEASWDEVANLKAELAALRQSSVRDRTEAGQAMDDLRRLKASLSTLKQLL